MSMELLVGGTQPYVLFLSSVGTSTGWMAGVRFTVGTGDFSDSVASTPAPEPPIRRAPAAHSPGIKCPGREADI
jgi:hypothetical protein